MKTSQEFNYQWYGGNIEYPLILTYYNDYGYKVNKPLSQTGEYVSLEVAKLLLKDLTASESRVKELEYGNSLLPNSIEQNRIDNIRIKKLENDIEFVTECNLILNSGYLTIVERMVKAERKNQELRTEIGKLEAEISKLRVK